MEWTLPGTVLSVPRESAENIDGIFLPMFLAGDIMLGQVAAITGLEPYIIQNWVKRGFLAPPVDKRYTLRQLCRVININMLRGILPMERICALLGYINGQLDDESDDLIDDSQLYFMLVRLSAMTWELEREDPWDDTLEKVLADYREPVPGAKDRIARVLRIMLSGHIAARMKEDTEQLLAQLDE